jgi:hypothetical protein
MILEAIAFGHVAYIAAIDGDVARASQLSAYMDERYRDLGMTREHTEEIVHAKLRAILDATLQPGDREAAAAEGRTWSRERAAYEAGRIVDVTVPGRTASIALPSGDTGAAAPATSGAATAAPASSAAIVRG